MPLQPGDLYFNNMFNDATRILEGGLWHNVIEEAAQGHGTDLRYINDIQIVQAGLQGFVAAGDFTDVQHDLRSAHLDIINIIQNDPVLQAASIFDGNTGFNFAPPMLGHPVNHNTPHETFAELGAIYDDAQSRMLAGPNSTGDGANKIQHDVTIVHDGLVTLMESHPELFTGLTGVHAQTIVNQLALQMNIYDGQYGTNIDAARATNDNFLDIDDI